MDDKRADVSCQWHQISSGGLWAEEDASTALF